MAPREALPAPTSPKQLRRTVSYARKQITATQTFGLVFQDMLNMRLIFFRVVDIQLNLRPPILVFFNNHLLNSGHTLKFSMFHPRYSAGHILNDLCSACWFTYLIIYLTEVKQQSESFAGILMLVGQVLLMSADNNSVSVQYGRL